MLNLTQQVMTFGKKFVKDVTKTEEKYA